MSMAALPQIETAFILIKIPAQGSSKDRKLLVCGALSLSLIKYSLFVILYSIFSGCFIHASGIPHPMRFAKIFLKHGLFLEFICHGAS